MKKRCKICKVIEKVLTELFQPSAKLDLRFGLAQPKQVCKKMTEIKITNAQKIKVTLDPRTQSNKPAELDGEPSWEVISGNSTVEPAEDGKSAELISSDDPGVTEILVKADADIGEGVEEIATSIILTVEGEHARNLGITVGEPELKETPAPENPS